MRTMLLCGATCLYLMGCGSEMGAAASANDEWAPSGNGTAADSKASTDAGAHYGTDAGSSQSADSTGVATPGAPLDQAIGLKPGGAQDIAFFRMKLAAKQLPKAADMTIEGWLNEHDTVLPPALKDRSVTLHAQAALVQSTPEATSDAVLQLGLNSGKSLADVTAKVALTVVIDRSGSMNGDKISYVRSGLHELVKHLPKDALVSLVSFSSGVTTDVAPAVAGEAQNAALDKAIDALQANGGTNLYGGLQVGMQHCKAADQAYPFRHILLLSDGVPTEGDTDHGHIEALAAEAATAGCTVSTVGVGFDFDPKLMTHIGQKGNGTAWFVQDASHAKDVFVQDLETILLPVAQKLTLSLELAAGWKVKEIYGFDWVEKDGVVQVTGAKKGTQTGGGPVDPGKTDPTPGGEVAMPTLYASKRNGMVMVQLQPPVGTDLSLAKDLQVAKVTYGYTLAKAQMPEVFTVPVQIPGLIQVPDEGVQYFTSPIVRRSWLLLHTGLDLMAACQLAEANQPDAAAAVLTAAVARLDLHVAKVPAEALQVVDISTPNLSDARQLLLDLKAVLPQP